MYDNVAQLLQTSGSIAVIPTDTVYGVVARAHDTVAVERLYQLKHREAKPGTLIAASIYQLVGLGIKRRYLTAVEQYWPGAISVIVPASDPTLTYLHQGKMSLSVRIPDSPPLIALLEKTGPLLTSSANHPGEPTSTTIDEAKEYFSDAVDMYVDGGDLSGRPPSTIIRVIDDAIEVVRHGAVTV